MRTIAISSRKRNEMIDITERVAEAVRKSGVSDGVCCIYVPHTTAGVTINENADPSVREDILACLGRLAPPGARYSHTEGNADSHIKASLVGSSVSVIVSGGKLVLGTWQGIFFCEFDGPRSRKVYVTIIRGQTNPRDDYMKARILDRYNPADTKNQPGREPGEGARRGDYST